MSPMCRGDAVDVFATKTVAGGIKTMFVNAIVSNTNSHINWRHSSIKQNSTVFSSKNVKVKICAA